MPGISVAAWLVTLALGVSAPTRPAAVPARPAPAAAAREARALREGDLVFQTSRSAQSRAIQRATASPWSHVGIVEVAPDGVFVIEAIGRVSRTPWAAWRARGAGDRALALRPRGLSDAALARAVAEARRHLGKPYDARFGWGDDRMYCSELVVKAYARGAGLALGRRQRLGELRIGGLERVIAARYGRVPRDLELVTPASVAADPALAPVPGFR